MTKIKYIYAISFICLLFELPYGIPPAHTALAHSEDTSDTVIIKMNDESFEPKDITIHVGETVIFENTEKDDRWPASNIHPTHDIYPEFDPLRPITPGENWEFKFDKAGTWKYHDHLSPGITGTINVTSNENSADKPTSPSIISRIIALFKYIAEKVADFFSAIGGFLSGGDKGNVNEEVLISENSKDIFNDEEALEKYIKKYGPKKTIAQLNLLSSEFGSCHDTAHVAGRISYELLEEKAFKECSAECHSGCYHGATEAYFKEHGTANITENLNTLCGNELNPFFNHQCLHGIGHGLMAWASYDLPEALKSCEDLGNGTSSCWSGVFMENIVGGLSESLTGESGHFTKYLNDNPHYPCNTVEEKHKYTCYLLQTSRMVQIFGGDFQKIAAECVKAPKPYTRICFESMGRDVGGASRNNAGNNSRDNNVKNIQDNTKWAIATCSSAPKGTMREGCLIGAVQDYFWDPSGEESAISFCKLLSDQSEKSACYNMIISRAADVLMSGAEKQMFCKKVEPQFTTTCAQKLL